MMEEFRTLHELVWDKADRHKEKTAVIYDDGINTTSISYKKMYFFTEKVSMHLKECGAEKEVVAILVKPSLFSPAVCLGIMNVPAAYLPLDPQIPNGLLRHLIKTLHIRLIVTQRSFLQNLKESIDVEIVSVDGVDETEIAVVCLSTQLQKYQQNLAFVITTSGTTGDPKIVRVPHSCILPNVTDIRDLYGVKSSDVVLQASPLTFDPSVVEMFSTLSRGAALIIVPELLKMIPSQLAGIIDRHNPTIIQATPTLIRNFGAEYIKTKLLGAQSALRVLSFGGEACPDLATLSRWKDEGNETELYNLYGITEVSCWATVNHVSTNDAGTDSCAHLGHCLKNTVLEVRSEDGKPLSEGVGQLFIGRQYGTCTINDEVLDDSEGMQYRASGDLVNVTDDGKLIYLGRTDNQIKRNGKRINLTQIEQLALGSDWVNDTTAIFIEDSNTVILFVKIRTEKDRIEDLWKYLKDQLPAHALPDKIFPVENVPITKHGKVDKTKLLQIEGVFAGNSHKLNKNYSENDMWRWYQHQLQELLQLSEVACKRCFLDVGGDSFKALKLMNAIEVEFGLYDINILESILKDTFLATCKQIVNLCNSQWSSEGEEKSGRKRKNTSSSVKCSAGKIHISESKGTFNVLNMMCMTCNRNFLVENEKRIISFNDSIAISRGTRYYHCSLECNSTKSCSTKICQMTEDLEMGLKPLWSCDTGKCVDASPLVTASSSLSEGTIYIGSHSHTFSAIDLKTGNKKWEIKLEDRVESSACLSLCKEYVVVGCYDGCVYVIGAFDGRVHWSYQTEDQVKCSPTVDPRTGLVYVGSHDYHLYSLDIKNSQCVWRRNIDDTSVFSSPCVCLNPHTIYVATLGGHLASIQPDTGDIKRQHKLCKPVFASPTPTDYGVIVACVDHKIYCFSYDLNEIWQFETENHIFSSPVAFGVLYPLLDSGFYSSVNNEPKQRLLIGSHDHNLYCLNEKGLPMWAHKMDSPVYATPFTFAVGICSGTCNNITRSDPAGMKHYTVVCSTKGQVDIVDCLDGKCIFTTNFPGEIFSSPVICGDKLIIGCRDNNVYCFQLEVKKIQQHTI